MDKNSVLYKYAVLPYVKIIYIKASQKINVMTFTFLCKISMADYIVNVMTHNSLRTIALKTSVGLSDSKASKAIDVNVWFIPL